MNLLKFLSSKKPTASASEAKDRLQILIARERTTAAEYDFMPELEREIIALIAKYIKVPNEDIKISMEKDGDVDVLDVNVQFPQASVLA